MSVCCLVFKPRDYMWGGLPHAVSMEHVYFLQQLCVFCIMGKCVFNWIWLSLSVLEKMKNLSLNFDLIKPYKPCTVSSCDSCFRGNFNGWKGLVHKLQMTRRKPGHRGILWSKEGVGDYYKPMFNLSADADLCLFLTGSFRLKFEIDYKLIPTENDDLYAYK